MLWGLHERGRVSFGVTTIGLLDVTCIAVWHENDTLILRASTIRDMLGAMTYLRNQG